MVVRVSRQRGLRALRVDTSVVDQNGREVRVAAGGAARFGRGAWRLPINGSVRPDSSALTPDSATSGRRLDSDARSGARSRWTKDRARGCRGPTIRVGPPNGRAAHESLCDQGIVEIPPEWRQAGRLDSSWRRRPDRGLRTGAMAGRHRRAAAWIRFCFVADPAASRRLPVRSRSSSLGATVEFEQQRPGRGDPGHAAAPQESSGHATRLVVVRRSSLGCLDGTLADFRIAAEHHSKLGSPRRAEQHARLGGDLVDATRRGAVMYALAADSMWVVRAAV